MIMYDINVGDLKATLIHHTGYSRVKTWNKKIEFDDPSKPTVTFRHDKDAQDAQNAANEEE